MPQLLLQELSVGLLQWQPQQQSLAHSVLTQVLAVSSLREAQAHALLSAIWHQVLTIKPHSSTHGSHRFSWN